MAESVRTYLRLKDGIHHLLQVSNEIRTSFSIDSRINTVQQLDGIFTQIFFQGQFTEREFFWVISSGSTEDRYKPRCQLGHDLVVGMENGGCEAVQRDQFFFMFHKVMRKL